MTGRPSTRKRNVVTSLELDSAIMEVNNERFQQTYRTIEENEVRYKEHHTDDADYLMVAFGSVARICLKAIEDAREQGIKIGLVRPITLWPFPTNELAELAKGKKGILVVELNAGQMIQDVKLATGNSLPVYHYGRMGGIVPSPTEVLDAFCKHFPQD